MRRYWPDFAILALLFLLPLALFWPQTMGGRTLLPAENLYQFEPYATYREVVRAPAIPHNALLSDLVLQNMPWKLFIRESLAQGEIPLWNPYQFSGIPFLAAGQQSALYPFSLLYYVLPLPAAYGWFTVAQLWLAGALMYGFLRGGLNIGRFGAALGGVTYQLAAFFVISAVFPMIIAAAAWLPLLLWMIEYTVQQRPLRGRPSSVPWVVVGALALGCNILAGHVEITYYTLLIMGYYAAARLLALAAPRARNQSWPQILSLLAQRGGWLLGMVVLGLALGAVQFIPLFEFASLNFRSGSASYEQVIGWAHPLRDLAQFILPNVYGNPSHHAYFDVFSRTVIPATINALGEPIHTIDWGIKNYVEGALYLGILPLALAAYGVLNTLRPRSAETSGARMQVVIFTLLALLGLSFMFGLPTYRLLYLLPGIDQLHSPFRWIFAVTFSAAVLAAVGADQLTAQVGRPARLRVAFAVGLSVVGGLTLLGLLLSYLLYPQLEPLVDRLLHSLALADRAFADARMFYSYQFTNILTFGVVALAAGGILAWAGRARPQRSAPWQAAAVGLVAVDLMIASWGFNPASDPALLDFTPPAIQWLQGQPGQWRYTTVEDPTLGEAGKIMNANIGWRYDLYDVRGYESIIPRQYVDYMEQIAPQRQLEFNRVAPLYIDQLTAVDWNRLALLNVRYLVTPRTLDLYDYLQPPFDARTGEPLPPAPVYEDDAVRIWELSAMPRAYIAQEFNGGEPQIEPWISPGWDVVIERDTGREKILHVNISSAPLASWLVISETYMPGWRAFVRPGGSDEDQERALPVVRVLENFQGVDVSWAVLQPLFDDVRDQSPAAQQIEPDVRPITVRMVYSPTSFQVGLFISFLGAVVLVFMPGVWLWRLLVVGQQDAGTARRVARNSLAPIILNLFNRGIDFGFALVMLRILGPTDAGIYFYAGFIFLWFDIFTNFGLDLFVTREVARDRSRAGRYFFSASALRLLLTVAGLVLLAGFLLARQNLIAPPLDSTGIIAIIILYAGLFPGSLSKGMTSLFYAFEQAEYPAAITTVATISKAILGVIVLVLGYGVIGLAAASIVTNIVTLMVLVWGGRKLIGGWLRPEIRLMRSMISTSWPLLANHFLATIFFQIDILIIEAVHGARMVGLYSVAYKWLAALNVIPAFFTQAMLPVMSRQAHEDRDALRRTYMLAIKLLMILALPVAVLFTFLAYFLTGILGGAQYLPDGAIATQIMIWSIPFGWINSLTQYVLIALDLQRRVMRAFVLAVSFNVISNLLLVPTYGYQAAALTTIASEFVLLVPFVTLLHSALGPLNWWQMIWRPAAAAGSMLVVMGLIWPLEPVIALGCGVGVYPAVLLALRPLTREEGERLRPLLPGHLHRRLLPLLAR
jgi:O-antigen/teichoic acid export membrane protein